MEITFSDAIENSLKGRLQRRGTNKNYFFRIIGSSDDYYENLRTLKKETEKTQSLVLFETDIIDTIKLQDDYNTLFKDLRQEIGPELFEPKSGRTRIRDLNKADISVCDDKDINQMFRKA